MKKLVLAIVFSLAFSVTYADETTGVKFFTGSWKEVLAEAQRQNKPVFVDIYTTWCGPCKKMSKEAFPDAKVGDKFNAHFVSYKIDAEKGEGIELARKFRVTAYPTSLFVSTKGDLIYRAIGYGGIDGLLAEADKAIEAAKDPKTLAEWEKEFESGKRDPEFLTTYLKKRTLLGVPSGMVLDEYLKTVPESQWTTPENLELLAGSVSSADSKSFDILLEQAPKLSGSATGQNAIMNMQQALQNSLTEVIAKNDEQGLEKLIAKNEKLSALFRPLTPEMSEEMALQLRMNFYRQTKNPDKYRQLAATYADTKLMVQSPEALRQKDEAGYKRFETSQSFLPDSVKKGEDFQKMAAYMKKAESSQVAMKLNNIAWSYYETLTDAKALNQALGWSKRSLELDPSPMHMDTYAHLLYKLGRKKEAIKTQEEAIAKEKTLGNDPKQYEEALAKMKVKP
ncbi:thioredoxin fold domain-containing protein [Larkinella insperata]|uniref:Thioredoxin fold domain-containing protein n=1 Tax=Larkinella insperata TaxID=332158 RepID=A0ABW3Q842_9BACT|nr:thioredoxin fold domain-containing protein [Larkinella insperata]